MLFSRWRFSKNKKVPVLTGTLDSKVFMEHRKEPRNIALLMEVLCWTVFSLYALEKCPLLW